MCTEVGVVQCNVMKGVCQTEHRTTTWPHVSGQLLIDHTEFKVKREEEEDFGYVEIPPACSF